MKNPSWWTDEHTSTWDRVKDAMKRDWEQTKADFSSKKGLELDQSAGNTVKQIAGKEPIPPLSQLTPKDGAKPDDWAHAERTYRYGVGARQHYGADSRWDEKLEGQLASEWKHLDGETTWDEAKASVRRGYEQSGT